MALALVIALPSGRRLAARRCGSLVTVLVSLIIAGVLLGGNSYWQGITQTTLGRVARAASPLRVLQDALSWTGVIIVLAICGVIASWVSHRYAARTWLLVVLTAAALVGPLEQAHLHTLDALNKHVGLGAWFAAIAAGDAVDRFITAAPAGQPRTLTCAACVIALAFPASLGHPVTPIRHQLGQLGRFHRHLPPTGHPWQRAPAGRRPFHRRVLPARWQPVAALVQYPQHRPARRQQYWWPRAATSSEPVT